MSIIGSNILAGAAGSGVSAYEIEQSLRFNSGDTHYLNRTPGSAGNRKTWTWSGWIKRGTLGSTQRFFSADDNAASATYLLLEFQSDDNLRALAGTEGSSATLVKETTMVFRDPSAWYHIVFKFDAANTSAVWYVNGEEITALNSSTNPSNQDYQINATTQHFLGRVGSSLASGGDHFNGYLAEVNFIDGSALTPSDFGEFDDNGVWRPIEYAGSYTGNSFYLKFASGDGTDSSGLSNTWTANNFTTSGTGTDVMSDTPTNNWATLNPLHDGAQVGPEDGNLKFAWSSTGNYHQVGTATIGMPGDGKWYWEVTKLSTRSDSESIGILREDGGVGGGMRDTQSGTPSYSYEVNGTKNKDASASSYGASYAVGDIIGVAVDLTPGGTSGTIEFYKNGVSQGTAYSDIDTSYTWLPAVDGYGQSPPSEYTLNFGQREFAYPPGTASATDYFNVVTYTGDNTEQAITGVGFQPDFVWVKCRNQSSTNHILQDVVRGAQKYITGDTTVAEGTSDGTIISFDSDGFTIGAGNPAVPVNNSGDTFVAWCWKAGGTASSNTDGTITSSVSANQDAGFSVVSFTGNATAGATVGHGLGVAPDVVLVKNRDDASDWKCYFSALGNTKGMQLQSTSSVQIATELWNDTSPTSSVFSLGTNNSVNGSSDDLIAYCWTEKSGVSKFGSYTGNGSSTGPFVECGFKPRLVIVKRTDAASNWFMYDTIRGTNNKLYVDADAAENGEDGGSTTSNTILSLSTGFQMTSGNGSNTSGGTYIFMAWAETFSADADFKSLNTANLPAPEIEDGSDYFNTVLYTGNGTTDHAITGAGFQPDFVWGKRRDGAFSHGLFDSIRGGDKRLMTNFTDAEDTLSEYVKSFDADGFTLGNDANLNFNTASMVAWNWLAGNGTSSNTAGNITSTVSANPSAGFSIVSWTSDAASSVKTMGHGLGVEPTFIVVKNRDVDDNWYVWHQDLPANTYALYLTTAAQQSFGSTQIWSTSSTTFGIRQSSIATGTQDCIAYCFAEVEGYSKFGSYTGNGSSDGPFVFCGFRPKFVCFKRTDSAGAWFIEDSVRGTYNVMGPELYANNSEAEATSSRLDFLSNGFKLRAGNTGDNASGGTYIYFAFSENPFGGSGVSPVTAR